MKKRILFLSLAWMAFGLSLHAQNKFSSKTGTAKFYAASALEDAKAENHQARIVLDASTKEIAISMLISSFEFEKALMQTHFNSDMESETYPKSTFSGKIISPESLTPGQVNQVKVKGDLTMHGVTKNMEDTGTLKFDQGKVTVHSEFTLLCTDFKVAARSGVDPNIQITFDAVLSPAQ